MNDRRADLPSAEMQPPARSRPVRFFLFWLVLASLLPGIVGGSALFAYQYREGRNQIELQASQTARALAKAVDNQIYRIQALGQGLATASTLARGDLADFHRQAREALKQAELAAGVVLLDKSGQQLVHTAREFGEPLPRTAIPELVSRVFETGRPAVSDLFVGPSLGRQVMAVSVPVLIDGRVAYALNIPMGPEAFKAILDQQQLPADWCATVLDSSATIVARTRANTESVGKELPQDFRRRFLDFDEKVFEGQTLDGVLALASFARSRDTHWGIGIAVPLDVSQTPLLRHVSIFALGFAALLSIGLGLAWSIGGKIARAFRGIVAQAGALGAGESLPRPETDVREAVEATRALDHAAGLLKSRQEALQVSEARFRSLWSANLVGLLVADSRGNVGEANDYYLEVIGYSREEMLAGKIDWKALTPPEWTTADEKAIAEGDAAGVCTPYEKEYLRRDGERRTVIVYGSLLPGEENKFLALVLDITDRRRAEKKIESLYAELEQRVEERTAELVAANRELEGFTFATSHDLRGPLGRINSFSTLLEQRCRDQLDGEGLLFLNFIRDNASRLTFLIDDLLAHARVAQQTLDLHPMEVSEIVGAVLYDKAADIDQAGARIRLSIPPVKVLADTHLLVQAVDNLLQNALKYRDPARVPVIGIGGRVEGERFVLWIKDNGIGFDMAYHDRIFEMFRRLHSHGEIQGSGIGLALVKRAMDRLGGRVWAESAPGEGATFYLELRLAPGGAA